MSDLIWWDLIYKITEKDLKKKEDVLTLLIHFLLIKSGYKCIGLGDDKTFSGSESGSEDLPQNWNSSNNFAIRYIQNGKLFILRGVPVDDNLVYNFLQVDTLAVTNVAFNVNDTVSCLNGSLDSLFNGKSADVIKKIQNELLNTGPAKEATTQTSATSTSSTSTMPQRQPERNPLLVPNSPLQVPPPASNVDPFWIDPDRDPLRVGQSDLDPFGRGGGMLFNPFGPRGPGPDPGAGIPGGLPRGSVPPGARFDPFGPAGTNPPNRPRPPPDADHFHPPGFDNWYM